MQHEWITQRQQLADDLNARLKGRAAHDILLHSLRHEALGQFALVSSFGAESAVLLHLVAVVDRHLPVLFLDTGLHFTETLTYRMELVDRLHLTNTRALEPDPNRLAGSDPNGNLHRAAPEKCCALRKTEVLHAALQGFDGWISGRKRFQSSTRETLPLFELDHATGHFKVNPLAGWRPEDVQTYMAENRLPRHPLVTKGFPSIGCAPCTSPVQPGEDPRAGRWRGSTKTECGIHFQDGRIVRAQQKEHQT